MKKTLILACLGLLWCSLSYPAQFDSSPTDGVKLVLHMNEGTGTKSKDSTKLGIVGNFDAGGTPVWVKGMQGNALNFAGGTQQNVTITPATFLPSGNYNFTVNQWVKRDNAADGVRIWWNIGNRTTSKNIILLQNPPPFFTSSTDAAGVFGFAKWGLGKQNSVREMWTMITYVHDVSANREKGYTNGLLIEEAAPLLTVDIDPTLIYVGGRNSAHSCACSMDDFVIATEAWGNGKIVNTYLNGLGRLQQEGLLKLDSPQWYEGIIVGEAGNPLAEKSEYETI